MVPKTPKNALTPLLPDRHPQPDLFICDVADAVLKDVMQHMEHPFYALSKKPETRIRRYEHNGNWIEITPSVKGLATIYDKDILIYCISQIMAKLKRKEQVSPRVRINSHELLIFTNRGTAGIDYAALSEAIDRLAGTRISTNIQTDGEEQYDNFGLIDAASVRRKNGLDGRLLWCEIKISDWVFNAIRGHEVLTLHPDYFRLRKPLERRVYEIARKHCGQQKQWKVSLEVLLKKTGSQSDKLLMRDLLDNYHLPDYEVTLQDEDVYFINRNTLPRKYEKSHCHLPTLKEGTLEKAKNFAPGYDIYALKEAWINHWKATGEPVLKNPDGAFIGFCKNRHETHPISFFE